MLRISKNGDSRSVALSLSPFDDIFPVPLLPISAHGRGLISDGLKTISPAHCRWLLGEPLRAISWICDKQ